METGQIIIWLFGGVLGYVALGNIQNSKQIATLSKDVAVMTTKVDHLTNQVNLFIKSELDTLKELVRMSHEGNKE